MLSPEELKERLKDRVVYVVCDGTGLHHATVSGVKNGDKSSRHSYDTIKKLSDYFENQESASKE